MVTQTLSKAFGTNLIIKGLAGIRVGISISSVEIAEILNKTKAPYNISTPASIIANKALCEEGISKMRKNVAKIIEQRTFLIENFKKIRFFGKILGENDANFLLVQVFHKNKPSNELAYKIYEALAEVEGVVVRFRGTELLCEGCLRITVGTEQENQLLLDKLLGNIVSDIVMKQ